MNQNPPLNCPQCGSEIRHIPAGISKAGKRYPEFWSCSNRCGYIWRKPQEFKGAIPKTISIGKILLDLDATLKRLEKKIDSLLDVSVIYPQDLKEPRPSEEIEEESEEL